MRFPLFVLVYCILWTQCEPVKSDESQDIEIKTLPEPARRERDLLPVLVCCHSGFYLKRGQCLPQSPPIMELTFPKVFDGDLRPSNKTPNEFLPVIKNPCEKSYAVYDGYPNLDEFYFLENASVLTVNVSEPPMLTINDYCLANIVLDNRTISVVAACSKTSERRLIRKPLTYLIATILSTMFLAATLAVYVLLPELHNLPGSVLKAHIAILMLAYAALCVVQLGGVTVLDCRELCLALAYIVHFSFLASFFWLNVMCFDIWWTFGGFRSMQGSIKQRDRKKFILYSIYAWGSASVLTVICMIMDFVPTIPKHIIRPEFGVGSCWFKNDTAKAIYFYGPMGVTVVCNICLFILTALKILRHKKDTAQHLKTSESRRHDDNKQWFNLYLKLFIVMGINWSMEIISWLGQDLPEYIWYLPDLTNTLQGVIIFIIFVWKDKIKRLLLKRLGCENRRFMSRQSTRSGERSGSSRTCASAYPLQEKSNQYTDSYRAKSNTTTTEESDCL